MKPCAGLCATYIYIYIYILGWTRRYTSAVMLTAVKLNSSEVEQQFSDASGYLITYDICQL